MNDDLLELAAITNLLLFLQEVQLANEFARQPNGRAAFAAFEKTLADRIQNRSRPEPGQRSDEQMIELQARMLARWQRFAASVESRRAEFRTRLTGAPD